ncbi:MAG: response regulator [Vampirovibrionales bacterium]|nr:response regulator [Vampirovibrionales bacterium]
MLTLQDKVVIGFFMTLLVFGILLYGLFSSLTMANSANEWSLHSYQVLNRIDDLYAQLLDAHRSQRGYVITGNKEFLKPYEAVKNTILQDLDQLIELTSDNATQQRHLGELKPLVEDELAVFSNVISIEQSHGYDASKKSVTSGRGEALMRRIKAVINKIESHEKRLLDERLKASKNRSNTSQILTIAGASLMLIILMVVYFLINREIEQRQKTAQDLMEARNEAQMGSKMKSEFLANMSHEIRTPMNGILGMAEIISNTDITNEQRRYLQMIDASGRALLTIINDILDFSKIEAGKLTLDPIRFKLRETIGEVLYPFSRQAADKNLELLFHVKSDVPNYVVGDPHRLRQILNNLIGNAVKFTSHGEIYVGLEVDTMGETSLRLHGWVSDTGIGLSKEKMALVFEPFTQADGSTTRRFGGTGLGLSISRQLVHMMNGHMWIDSEEGKGSTFHFIVELEIVDKPNQPIIPADIALLKGLPVLVVDDNATSREIFKEFLREWQMTPMLVENAKMALEILRHASHMGNAYPLALLDVGMPDMDGFQLTEEIKKDARLSQTKIILLTSYGQPGDAARCQELNIDGYLTKPVGQQSLLYCIRSIFSPSLQKPLSPAPLSDAASTADYVSIGPATDRVETENRLVLTETYLRQNRHPLRILLAEDNEINQAVAVHILQEAGHWVDVASNGKKALDYLSKNSYNLILMDIHMPEMDGFEATASIRNQEMSTKEHIPIIALTANAIKGDRETCLEAGMDGYLSKPFRKQELLDILENVLYGKEPTPLKRSEGNLIDKDALLNRVGNDLSLLNQLITMFNGAIDTQLADIKKAIDQADGEALENQAHTLKGAIGNFTEAEPYLAAKSLELNGKEKSFDEAEHHFETLSLQVAALRRELKVMAEESMQQHPS